MLNFTLVSTERVSVLMECLHPLQEVAGGKQRWDPVGIPVGPEEWAQERLKLSLLPLAPGN